MTNFDKVGIFMKTFGQEVKDKPSFSTDKINKLRIDLIKEELNELTEALNNKDLLEVADALTDILYVTYGAGHAFGLNLDLSSQLGIILTATLASIGTAAVPSAGIVMLVIVLAQAGIPEAGLALIFAVDRPLDMCRTIVNVTGDAAVSSIVNKSLGNK